MKIGSFFSVCLVAVITLHDVANAAFITQTATIDYLAVGSQDYMGNAHYRAFPRERDYQQIGYFSNNQLQFRKFNTALGKLNEVRLSVSTDLHMSIVINPVSSSLLAGYSPISDFVTNSVQQFHDAFYLDRPAFGQMIIDQSYVYNRVNPLGLYLNLDVAWYNAIDVNYRRDYRAAQSFNDLLFGVSYWEMTSPLDSFFTHHQLYDFAWTLDSYYLYPGDNPGGVIPGYPPWHPFEIRDAGSYEFSTKVNIVWTYDYTPNGFSVPEPASFTLVRVLGGLIGLAIVFRRLLVGSLLTLVG